MKLETEIAVNTSVAGCRACGRVFSGVTAFDKHQRVGSWGVRCLDPATVGLELKRSGRWGQPASDYSFTRELQNAHTEIASDTFTTTLVSSPRGG